MHWVTVIKQPSQGGGGVGGQYGFMLESSFCRNAPPNPQNEDLD